MSNIPRRVQLPSSSGAPLNWTELEAKYKQDIETLTESAEMATIEKEIAEEKLDSCERQLQETKDKLAEATLQIDMIKREQHPDQPVGAGSSESPATVLQLQKVEEQNELLKQALIKLRDMSTKDKKLLEDLEIEHEELQVKVLDLEVKEQKYLEQIKNFEEQIDINQSSQEMVEKLSQQKTELEDKLKEMVDDFDCMQKLRDLNDQLLENARENEIELTSEIDKLKVQCSELNSKRRDLEEYLTDQERTVAKLKEENRILNDHLSQLKDEFKESESIEQKKHQMENINFQLTFSKSRMAEKEAEVNRYKRNLAEMEEQMNNLSLITKEQSTRLDEFKVQYDLKCSENAELQRALKKKMEEVSELEIRKERAEKKLQTIQSDKEAQIARLTKTIETMKGVEVQHEEDMKRLMEDNELIERERRDLRDQLSRSNRSLERTMQTGNMSMVTAQDTSLISLGISIQSTPSIYGSPAQPVHHTVPPQQFSSTPQTAQTSQICSTSTTTAARRLFVPSSLDADSDTVLTGRIKDLSAAFGRLSRKNYELEVELASHELNNHVPPFAGSNLNHVYNIDEAKRLSDDALRLKREIRSAIINQQICIKSRNIQSQVRKDHFNMTRLVLECQRLEERCRQQVSQCPSRITLCNNQMLESTPVR